MHTTMAGTMELYDELPSGMKQYLRHYGWHFSPKMVEWAASMMVDRKGNAIKPYKKDELVALLESNGVDVDEKFIYDALYVANMAKADFLGSSIADEAHLAKFVGDYLNDKDGYTGQAFARFYADLSKQDIPVYWEDVL